MIKYDDIHADLHVHTIFSLHAYSTLKECIDAANNQGIKFLAITDHFYADGTILNQKNEVVRLVHLSKRLSRIVSSPQIISGAEFNIGQKTPSWEKLHKLPWRLLGIHAWFININEITLDELKNHYLHDGIKFNA